MKQAARHCCTELQAGAVQFRGSDFRLLRDAFRLSSCAAERTENSITIEKTRG